MATLDRDEPGQVAGGPSPLLRDGQRLDQPTFHALYLQTPDHFRAELIEGVVHVMAPAVRYDHCRFDSLFSGFFNLYATETPGTVAINDGTTKLNPQNEFQPDVALLIESEAGGQISEDEQGYIVGCPELVVEIASSTLSTDLRQKKRVYEAVGAREYVVVDIKYRAIHWFTARRGRFATLDAGPDGVFRSVAFPGLGLNAPAFLREDRRAVSATLVQGMTTEEHAAFVAAIGQRRANRP